MLLTRMSFCKSLSSYTLNTLTATVCPWYSRFHTSPYPPRRSGAPVRLSPSSMRNELGSSSRLAHVLYNRLRHPLRICVSKLRFFNAYQETGVKCSIPGHGGVTPYLVNDVNKGLDLTFREAIDQVDHSLAREDRLNERNEFALRDAATCQASQSLLPPKVRWFGRRRKPLSTGLS